MSPSAGSVGIFGGAALVLVLVFALILLGAAAEPASAATGRPYLETIPTSGDSPGALTADTAGNLYLSNYVGGNPVVEKIDPAGNPVNFTASAKHISGNRLLYTSADTAVSKVNGFIYLTRGYLQEGTGGEATVFAPSGEYLGLIPTGQYVCGLGLDPTNGDVYQSGLENSVIPRYEVVGANPADDVLTGRLKILSEYNGGCNLEVDSTRAIYISTGDGRLVKFTQADISPRPET